MASLNRPCKAGTEDSVTGCGCTCPSTNVEMANTTSTSLAQALTACGQRVPGGGSQWTQPATERIADNAIKATDLILKNCRFSHFCALSECIIRLSCVDTLKNNKGAGTYRFATRARIERSGTRIVERHTGS